MFGMNLHLNWEVLFSFKYEAQQTRVVIEAFLRSSVSEPFFQAGVEPSRNNVASTLGEPLQI